MSPLIIALDYSDITPMLALVDCLDPSLCRVKVGKELFTRYGPDIVRRLQSMGFEVFLDLKFHDIPHTVAQAVDAAASLGVWMVNVHASGGQSMMKAARAAIELHQYKTLLTAVTVLTSMVAEDLREVGLNVNPLEQVVRLGTLAMAAGMDGLVCSAQEAVALRTHLGKQALLVTPGIRPADSAPDDQKRTLTPHEALQAGSSFLVVGRPVTRAAEPAKALHDLLQSLAG